VAVSAEQETLLAIRGAVYGLALSERETVEKCAEEIRQVVARHTMYGAMALALVGAEMAAQT
jgi:hypothetical protein